MVLVEDKTVLLDYEADFDLLYFERRGPCTLVPFREAMGRILKMVVEKKVRFLLINATNSEQFLYEDQVWLLEKLDLTFFENHILEKVAMVMPRDHYNLMATESILEHMLEHTHFEFQYFNEVASARDWLEESFREVCFFDEGLEIEYNAYHHWIYANWKGHHDFATVKRGCELIADLLTTKGCTKFLNDNRLAQGNWDSATRWVAEVWIPRQEQNGLKAVAWVLSPSTLHRLSAQNVLEIMQTHIQIEVFNEYSKAKHWLQLV
jgi:hypothetical protein